MSLPTSKLANYVALPLVVGAILFFSLSASSSVALGAGKKAYDESLVRAAVIFGILRFTDWPDSTSSDNTLKLCSLGPSASSEAIGGLQKIPRIGKTSIEYHSISSLEAVDSCHALIVGKGESLDIALSSPTLLICDDCEVPVQERSAIELKRIGDRVKFKVNLDYVEQQNIRLSSSLIELAVSCTSTNPSIKGCNDG